MWCISKRYFYKCYAWISRFSEMLKIKHSTNNAKVSFYLCVLNLLIHFTASWRLDSLVVVCLSSNQKLWMKKTPPFMANKTSLSIHLFMYHLFCHLYCYWSSLWNLVRNDISLDIFYYLLLLIRYIITRRYFTHFFLKVFIILFLKLEFKQQ